MFVRYYVELMLPYEAIVFAMTEDPRGWVPGLAREAEARGARLLADVGFGSEGLRLNKEIEVELGDIRRLEGKSLLPMTWKAAGSGRLFPTLDADIEVAAIVSSRTQLAISARYRPPLGKVGTVIDRAMLHLVAEATIKDFLDRVTHRLRRSLAACSA